MRNFIYCLFVLFFVSSCSSQKIVRYTIASHRGDCRGGNVVQECYLVKRMPDTSWTFFYAPIGGFDYEEGYEYVVDVKEIKLKDFPADASSVEYSLVDVVSKVPCSSAGLPVSNVVSRPYLWFGKVLSNEVQSTGRGAAKGHFVNNVLKVLVTSSECKEFKEGDVIYCEVTLSPTVVPVAGREYVFKAKMLHPSHYKGVYLLDTDVMDLVH